MLPQRLHRFVEIRVAPLGVSTRSQARLPSFTQVSEQGRHNLRFVGGDWCLGDSTNGECQHLRACLFDHPSLHGPSRDARVLSQLLALPSSSGAQASSIQPANEPEGGALRVLQAKCSLSGPVQSIGV